MRVAFLFAFVFLSVLGATYQRVSPPLGWRHDATASLSLPLSLYFVTPLPTAHLEAELLSRSSPNSAKFRQWLSREHIEERFVDPVSVAAVKAWGKKFGLVEVAAQFVCVRTTVGQAARMLRTRFAVFRSNCLPFFFRFFFSFDVFRWQRKGGASRGRILFAGPSGRSRCPRWRSLSIPESAQPPRRGDEEEEAVGNCDAKANS